MNSLCLFYGRAVDKIQERFAGAPVSIHGGYRYSCIVPIGESI